MRARPLLILLSVTALLTGCDVLGIETGTATAARKEAEGKATGSACRHAMRAIEDCYTLNTKASKAAVYAGWLEMDQYMRDNKIEGVVPVIPRKSPKPPAAAASAAEGEEAPTTAKPEAHASGESADPVEKPAAGHAAAKPARAATTH